MAKDFIEFLNSKQSERNYVFMFIWRILLAILLTQQQMEYYKYSLKNLLLTKIALVNYLFSSDFLLVIIIYLWYIFLFFWFFKFVGAVMLIRFSRKQFNEVETLTELNRFNFVKKSDNNLGYSIYDYESFNELDKVIKDLEIPGRSKILSTIGDYLNLLYSTTIAVFYLSRKLITVIKPWKVDALNVALWVLCIFATIMVIHFLKIIARTENVTEIRNKLYEIYKQENPTHTQ